MFNTEKLLWLNFHYLKERPDAQLAHEIKPFIGRRDIRFPAMTRGLKRWWRR